MVNVLSWILAALAGLAVLALTVSLGLGIATFLVGFVVVSLMGALLYALVLYLFFFAPKHVRQLLTLYKRVRFLFFTKRHSSAGERTRASRFWDFQKGPTCAINAQRIVLAMFGIVRSESELMQRQGAFGKFNVVDGSSSEKLLLEGYGLDVKDVVVGSSADLIFRVWDSLRRGRIVLLRVNAFQLNNFDEMFRSAETPLVDHLIIITEVESSGGGNLILYYTDTGVFDGSIKRAPAEAIVSASGLRFVETPRLRKMEANARQGSTLKKDIRCIGCGARIRVPLGIKGFARCPRCKTKFPVDE